MRKTLFTGLAALGLTLLALLSVPRSALAQQPTPSDDEVNAIAKQLFCPVCENTPLDVCPTQACAQWRELIREKLADGWSEEQIKDYFVEQYGARVVGVPPAEGSNLLLYGALYVIVIGFIIGGAIMLYEAVKSSKKPAGQPPAEAVAPPPASEYVTRLEEELRKR